ncbi:polynucleotide kinase-phosphatase [Candidatus Leptofilum sp.]|uniref:polynucleotide kinase-phosphatase n=1 Tax=Candidatus Leptofilum sp. TaxID=3241576 RepID=UPI003B5AD8F0
MKLNIPELALVVLIGPSGAGKSTFARQHFLPTEVLSSDYFRGLLADDENDQTVTKDAFEALNYIAAKRLANGRLTVIDATNVKLQDRKQYVQLARQYHVLPVAIVLDLPESVCQKRNEARADRSFGKHVIRNQIREMRRSLRRLKKEGFRRIHTLKSVEDVATAEIQREPLWNNRKDEHGPFDIIGDIHGCADELELLLEKLGYVWEELPEESFYTYHRVYKHPEGRKAIFLGDLVDRGPRILDSYQLVHHMVKAGHALCVPGNHDTKLMRCLNGRNVQIKYGLQQTLDEIQALPDVKSFEQEMAQFIYSLVSHYVLDDGKLVVAHAGLKEELQGRASSRVRDFALYGETTGETDEFGLPIRYNWALEYRGEAAVVYGHTPVPQAEWLNNTINVDTGCVFGGALTALRYPERELISIPAAREYAKSARPLQNVEPENQQTAQQLSDDMLDLADVTGKRIVQTRLRRKITLEAENSTAALEVMSRFAVSPKWLIYFPPTMSPTETSREPELLEHPVEAFNYYRKNDVKELICQEKHMGSRAVVIVGQSETAVQKRFGVAERSLGIVYTRTGRRFFADTAVEQQFLRYLQEALTQANFWEQMQTSWVCLDCELMPWSEKAQALLKDQYAAVGAAAEASLGEAIRQLEQLAQRQIEAEPLKRQFGQKAELIQQYRQAYRNYCWPVQNVSDLRLAPFHILATENRVHADKNHRWHMDTIKQIVAGQAADILLATNHIYVNLSDAVSEETAVHWWKQLTQQGGEGMVIKPVDFITFSRKGLVQPAMKCRGREYLRIIYGPEYTLPEHLQKLKNRNVGRKRSLALREFALGIEALERFVKREPLRHVHECVFGVLALESEPIDPRL